MPHDLMEERAARTESARARCRMRSRHWRVRTVEAACGSTARDRERIGGRGGKSVMFSGRNARQADPRPLPALGHDRRMALAGSAGRERSPSPALGATGSDKVAVLVEAERLRIVHDLERGLRLDLVAKGR